MAALTVTKVDSGQQYGEKLEKLGFDKAMESASGDSYFCTLTSDSYAVGIIQDDRKQLTVTVGQGTGQSSSSKQTAAPF